MTTATGPQNLSTLFKNFLKPEKDVSGHYSNSQFGTTDIVFPDGWHGYTRLHITANHKLKAVDGLLTGLHEPEASHLDLLTAFLPSEEIHKAYDQAIRRKYLWHEFGDLSLIL
jgi:S-adenosylmethionine:tRNA-ribosyltransferase-isomerase (queuine synthetase)